MSLLVEMDDNDSQRIMEEIICGGSGTNVPTYTEHEGSQVDLFLNMSAEDDNNADLEHTTLMIMGNNKALTWWKVLARYIHYYHH